jgi:hypothetical protein
MWMMLCCLAMAGRVVAAAPASLLDRGTGATIQFSGKPWMLALDQPHLAAHARDYIALYALEINTAGQRRYHLAAFFWSTVPGRASFAGNAPEMTLRVADREIRLSPLGRSPRDMGISRWPMTAPGHGAVLAIYEVDEPLLRAMSTDVPLKAHPETDPTLPADIWFDVWRSGRRAFADFCARAFD